MNPSTLIGAAVGIVTLIVAVGLSAGSPALYANLPGLAIVLRRIHAALAECF